MLKIIVMSDLHLVPPGEMSEGLDTAARLRAAVRSVNHQHADADFCILAGDLTDRGDVVSYRRLRDITADLAIPVHVTLGNHDHRQRFEEAYGGAHLDGSGFAQTAIDAKGYRVIVLDSSEPGRGEGVLCETRLAWLERRLAEANERPVIIVLHHHALPIGTDVDRLMLEDANTFIDVLKRHPDVRQILSGHVHLPSTSTFRGLPFTTIKGNSYGVTVHLDGMPGAMKRLDGPAQYALVLADADRITVHFHNYVDRHLVPADV